MTAPLDLPMHAQHPTTRFSDRVADYVAHRPSYPEEAITAILAGLGDPRCLHAADVGAGTGISSRLLAERGVRVTAVEPNGAMRAGAAAHPNVRFVDGTAERTALAEGACDLVVCAQAFHWFEPVKAFAEFGRVLRPGGRLAIMWNVRDRSDAFTAGYSCLMVEVAQGEPVGERELDMGNVRGAQVFTPFQKVSFPFRQVLTAEGLEGRALSASYSPKEGPAHEKLVRGLREVFGRFAKEGVVSLVYKTDVYLANSLP
jgi:SAM-dependent methyltransferase